MKKTNYFSHDSNARTDEKILKIRSKYGMAGYGLYFAIIEMLRDATAYRLQCQYDVIAYELHEPVEKIKDIIEGFDLFFLKDDCFTSKSLNSRMKIKDEIAKKYSENAKKRWDAMAIPRHSNGNANFSDGNASKVKESKVKESKEIVADATGNGFDFDSYRKTMLDNTNPAIKIIAGYWMIKGFTFTNAKQTAVALKRELIPANSLTSYELKRIGDTMRWLKQNADFKWTLESVSKFINEDLENLEKLKDKNHYKCKKGLWHKTGQPCGH